MKKYGKRRCGSALVETAAGLVILSALIIGGLMLLIDGASMFYVKIKLATAAQTGANFAIDASEWLGAPRPNVTQEAVTADVKSVVGTSLREMGLGPADEVEVSNFTDNGKRFCKVTIKSGAIGLMTNGLLPGSVNLSETACVAFGNRSPVGVLGLTIGQSPNGRGVIIPIYAATNMPVDAPNTFPAGRFPYYAAGVQAESSNSMSGPFQNWGGGGDFKSY